MTTQCVRSEPSLPDELDASSAKHRLHTQSSGVFREGRSQRSRQHIWQKSLTLRSLGSSPTVRSAPMLSSSSGVRKLRTRSSVSGSCSALSDRVSRGGVCEACGERERGSEETGTSLPPSPYFEPEPLLEPISSAVMSSMLRGLLRIEAIRSAFAATISSEVSG